MRRFAVILILCSSNQLLAEDPLDDAREEYLLALSAVEAEYDNFRRFVRQRRAVISVIQDEELRAMTHQQLDAYEARVEKLFVEAVKVIGKMRQRYLRQLLPRPTTEKLAGAPSYPR